MIAGVVNGHVACKYVYVRLFRGTTRMQERNLVSVGTWVALVFAVWIIAWIIAESIPVFNNLLGLIVCSSLPCWIETDESAGRVIRQLVHL